MITRREFLASAAMAAVPIVLAADEPALAMVDTHTHFYDPSRPEGVPWPPPTDKLLYRRIRPAEYIPMAKREGIIGTVVIEASPWRRDNDWLLDLAADEPFILGVVGNLDPLAESFPHDLDLLARNPRFLGIRVSGAQLIGHGTESQYLRSMARLAESGKSLDLNGPPDYLVAAAALARKTPTLRIILDHVGSAGDAHRLTDEWRDGMRAAAQCENIFCKVSGMPEQAKAAAGQAPVEFAYYQPILDFVLEQFRADRLIFGSNWPVSNKGTTFENVVAITRKYFAAKSTDVQRRVFAANARAFYRWPGA
jgi:L-fuconolactonase